jgi:hypothetical protein
MFSLARLVPTKSRRINSYAEVPPRLAAFGCKDKDYFRKFQIISEKNSLALKIFCNLASLQVARFVRKVYSD